MGHTYALDEKASNMLRDFVNENPTAATEVMADMSGVRNPSGAISSRIKRYASASSQHSAPPMSARPRTRPTSSGSTAVVEAFISQWSLDGECAQKLRNCNPAQQDQVINGKSMTNVRNPNAVVSQRIREVLMNSSI